MLFIYILTIIYLLAHIRQFFDDFWVKFHRFWCKNFQQNLEFWFFFFFPKQINFFFNFLLSFFFFLCNCFRFLFCFVFPPPYWHLNSTHGWKHFSENSSPKKNKQLKIFCFFFFLLNSLQDWLTAIHIQQHLPTDVILKNQTTAKNIRALCMQNKYSALLFFCIWKHYLLLDVYVQVDNFF